MFPAPRRQAILHLALPIIGGMVSQNVANLVDTAMVGRLGDDALAAVGMGSFANYLAIAFIIGLSTGVQAMAARRLGEGKHDETAVPLNGGLLLAVAIGVPWSVLLIVLSPTLFPYLVPEGPVADLGVGYFNWRLIGVVAVGMNFSFRGYFNGISQSRVYLQTIVLMHVANVFFNWVFIFGHLGAPALGAPGAGLGTMLANYLATAVYFLVSFKLARGAGFFRGIPGRETMLTMLRLAVPSGLQQLFFAGGMTVFMWIVGLIGTAEMAITSVLIQLLLVAILVENGFGMAAASLVGQALGRKDVDDASQWAWDVVKLAMTVVAVMTLPAALFAEQLLGVFVIDPATLALGIWPLRLLAIAMPLDAIGMILFNALLGAGDTKRVLVLSVVAQWGLFLPACYVLGPKLGMGLMAIWIAQVLYRGLTTVIMAGMWRGRQWATIKV